MDPRTAYLQNLAEVQAQGQAGVRSLSLGQRFARARAAFAAPDTVIDPVSGLADNVDEPWNSAPPGSQPFSWPFVMNLPASGSAETGITGTNGLSGFQVPIGWGGGVVNSIACGTNAGGFQDGSGTLIWRVRKNYNQYVKNYDNIQVRLGPQAQFPGSTLIILIPGDFLEWTIQNVSLTTATSQVFGFFGGYYWPVQP